VFRELFAGIISPSRFFSRLTQGKFFRVTSEEIYQKEVRRVSRKFTHMRYHSFLMYFGVLKRLGWVEVTNKNEPSAIQDNYTLAPKRVYYRLTKEGTKAGEEPWSNPLFTLYPEIGPSHMKKPD
jgi:hypothetical protein